MLHAWDESDVPGFQKRVPHQARGRAVDARCEDGDDLEEYVLGQTRFSPSPGLDAGEKLHGERVMRLALVHRRDREARIQDDHRRIVCDRDDLVGDGLGAGPSGEAEEGTGLPSSRGTSCAGQVDLRAGFAHGLSLVRRPYLDGAAGVRIVRTAVSTLCDLC